MRFVQFERRILLCLIGLLGLAALAGCAPRTKHFGIIFTSKNSAGSFDIYRIPDNTQKKVEQLTFTPTIGESYGLWVTQNGDRLVFGTDFYANFDEIKPSERAIEELRHIYLLDTTSKKLTDITKVLEPKYAQIGPEFYMDWSPDKKQFVVITHEGAGYEFDSFLEFVDVDGKNRKDILIPTTGNIPALIQTAKWSPDGKKFFLTQGVIGVKQQVENPGSAILIYALDSGKLTQITDYKDHCRPVEWSPTSRQIVATCSYVPPYGAEGVSGPETVRIFDVDNPGQPYERIGFSPCDDPVWSPGGKQIAFVCGKGTDQAGLFIVNFDGGGIHEVKSRDWENLAVIKYSAWSPDGKQIAFVRSNDTDRAGLFIANSDGSGIHELKLDLKNLVVLKNPVWSPDGTQIVYVTGSDYKHTKIYSIYADGSNNHPLTDQEAVYQDLSVYPIP
jgi:Tol biopolymer transport system component